MTTKPRLVLDQLIAAFENHYEVASSDQVDEQALIDAGLTVENAELRYIANTSVPVSEEDAEKVDKLLNAIDDLDDVTNVFTNAE